jgi:transposase InsO family protein
MKLHGNARTCPNSRALIARRVLAERWSLAAAAEAAGVSEPTARKWVKRARAAESLADRSSRPRRSPTRLAASLVGAIERLRRVWMTAAEIAEILGLALSTVSLWLKRIGLGKRSRLAPPEPPNRYERRHPGELVHVDIKQLGRIVVAGHRVTGSKRGQRRGTQPNGLRTGTAGWEYVHVMVDDHSRLAYAEVLDGLTGRDAVAFLRRAVAWFAERGVKVKAVMSDNGSCYVSDVHRQALRELGLRHLRIRPRRPRTNGKAERFIQTMLNEWAYVRVYGTSAERTAALPLLLERYNFRRPHGSLGKKAPPNEVEQPRWELQLARLLRRRRYPDERQSRLRCTLLPPIGGSTVQRGPNSGPAGEGSARNSAAGPPRDPSPEGL